MAKARVMPAGRRWDSHNDLVRFRVPQFDAVGSFYDDSMRVMAYGSAPFEFMNLFSRCKAPFVDALIGLNVEELPLVPEDHLRTFQAAIAFGSQNERPTVGIKYVHLLIGVDEGHRSSVPAKD